MDEVQKINVKVFLDIPAALVSGDRLQPTALDAFLPIFARWREESDDPARWIDMADYAHMSRGPGVMIIGHRGNLAVDLADPGPGLLYANKAELEGSTEQRIQETFRRALSLFQRLASEPEYPAGVSPRPGSWQLTFNDRLEMPNTNETHAAVGRDIAGTIRNLFGEGFTMIRESDPIRRYGFTIQSEAVESLDRLATRLAAAANA